MNQENTLRARDDFDDLRAERDMPTHYRNEPNRFAGLWKQIADAKRPDGTNYSVYGIGGSWFRYGGNFQWSWQRDFFDFGTVSALFLEMIQNNALSAGMQARIQRSISGEQLPGWYPAGQAPVPLW